MSARHLAPAVRQSAPMEKRFRFGRFELDTEAQELRRSGLRVKLQARPFRILALLVSRSGAIVTREEIREHVWGADTWVDFDHNVSFCVHQIRLALNDRASTPAFIETVPRRGYRFVGRVERGSPASPDVATPLEARGDHRRGRTAAAAAVLPVLTLGIAVARERPDGPAPRPPSPAEQAFLRGAYLRQAGPSHVDEARDALETAVRLDASHTDARTALAELYLEIADRGLRPSR